MGILGSLMLIEYRLRWSPLSVLQTKRTSSTEILKSRLVRLADIWRFGQWHLDITTSQHDTTSRTCWSFGRVKQTYSFQWNIWTFAEPGTVPGRVNTATRQQRVNQRNQTSCARERINECFTRLNSVPWIWMRKYDQRGPIRKNIKAFHFLYFFSWSNEELK